MSTLGKRYFNYVQNSRKLNAQKEYEKKMFEIQNEIIEKENKTLRDYNHHIMNIKGYRYRQLLYISDNLYLTNENRLIAPIRRNDFLDDLSNADKNHSYSVIRSAQKISSKRTEQQYAASFAEFNRYYHTDTSDYNDSKHIQNQIYSNNRDPQEFTFKLLYGISSGDFKNLTPFLNLCYKIKSSFNSSIKTKCSLKPTVILAAKELHQSIINFFEAYTNYKLSHIDYNTLTKLKGLHSLVIEQYFGKRANLVVNGPIPETDFSVKRLSKLMSGKKVSVKDHYFPGYLNFTNRMPFVYITDSHIKYRNMKTIYGANSINIPLKNFDPNLFNAYCAFYIYSNVEILIKALCGNKKEYSQTSKKVTNDDILKEFVQNCCRIKVDAVCEKAKLYEAYIEYHKNHFGDKPLTKIIFGKKIALFGNFETIRPHSSRNYYPYCFKGIEIDKEKIKNIEHKETLPNVITYEEFKGKVLDMLEPYMP